MGLRREKTREARRVNNRRGDWGEGANEFFRALSSRFARLSSTRNRLGLFLLCIHVPFFSLFQYFYCIKLLYRVSENKEEQRNGWSFLSNFKILRSRLFNQFINQLVNAFYNEIEELSLIFILYISGQINNQLTTNSDIFILFSISEKS